MDSNPNVGDGSRRVLQKTARGIFWNFVTYGVSKGVVLLTTAILARLLSKDDFGVVALAVIAINYLSVVKDLGLGIALVQRRDEIDRSANTVFTLNLIFGLFLSAILIPLANPVAAYFKNQMVAPVLQWLGLTFFIGAFSSVHVVWLMRELDYRRKLIPDMGSALVKALVSIGLALAGYGVWALVFGQLLGVLTSVVLFWVIVPWRPRLMLDSKIIKALLAYGSSVIGSDIINVSIDNLGYIVIGRVLGTVQLGVYTLAYRLPEMLLMGNLWIMASVTFPAFANIQNDMNSLRRGFLGSIRLVQLIAVPICLGLIIVAEPIILVMFGAQWMDAVPILRILAVYVFVASVGYHVGDVYKAIGRPDILFGMTIFTLVLMGITLYIGSSYGLEGIAWAYVVAFFIERVVSLALAERFIQVSLVEIFSEMLPSLKGGLVLAFTTFLVSYGTSELDIIMRLICLVITGIVSYLGFLWVSERENLFKLIQLIRKSE